LPINGKDFGADLCKGNQRGKECRDAVQKHQADADQACAHAPEPLAQEIRKRVAAKLASTRSWIVSVTCLKR
jgi:hypothetical protein